MYTCSDLGSAEFFEFPMTELSNNFFYDINKKYFFEKS